MNDGEREIIGAAAKGLSESDCYADRAVCVVALAHIHDAGQCFPASEQDFTHSKRVNMCCGKVSISMRFLSLRKEVSTFREMITGATAVFCGISESERYSVKHMWRRKAVPS